jgi:hypothetical protein
MSTIPASSNLGDIQIASVKARQSFDPLFAVLKEYKEHGRESQQAASVPTAKKPFFEENFHELRAENAREAHFHDEGSRRPGENQFAMRPRRDFPVQPRNPVRILVRSSTRLKS